VLGARCRVEIAVFVELIELGPGCHVCCAQALPREKSTEGGRGWHTIAESLKLRSQTGQQCKDRIHNVKEAIKVWSRPRGFACSPPLS
jgi:hypothetical protein